MKPSPSGAPAMPAASRRERVAGAGRHALALT